MTFLPQFALVSTQGGTITGALTASGGLTVTGTTTVNGIAIPDGILGSVLTGTSGILAQNYPSYFTSNSAALGTAGVGYLVKIPLTNTQISVTNILTNVITAGGTLTAAQCFICLYDNNGTKVGFSADQSAAWGSTGLKTAALAGGPFNLTAPFCYVFAYFNGTTGPAFARGYQATGAPGSITLNQTAATGLAVTNGSALTTTPPASVTYSSNSNTTANPQYFWAALS